MNHVMHSRYEHNVNPCISELFVLIAQTSCKS